MCRNLEDEVLLNVFDLELDYQTELPFPTIIRRAPGTAIRGFQVFGERNSGTNFLEHLIERNTSLKAVRHYGWKHGFPVSIAYHPQSLILLIYRDPVNWLVSMFNSPYASLDCVNLSNFSSFIRSEWGSFLRWHSNERWGGTWNATIVPGLDGQECVFDRNPITGERFTDVFELRWYKLVCGLSLRNRECNFIALPYEGVSNHRQSFIKYLRTLIGDEESDRFDPIVKKVSPKSARRRPLFRREMIETEDSSYISRKLDHSLERAVGYDIKF